MDDLTRTMHQWLTTAQGNTPFQVTVISLETDESDVLTVRYLTAETTPREFELTYRVLP